jgi:hypothetical protein
MEVPSVTAAGITAKRANSLARAQSDVAQAAVMMLETPRQQKPSEVSTSC